MSELFLSILNMSLTASYVILFVILVRLILKKVPKVISYALWGVAAFRLLIPFSFESMFSLMPRNTNSVLIPHDIIYQQNPQINSGIEVVDSFISQSLPAPTIGASVNPLQVYIEIGAYIWALGIIALLVYSLVSILILKRQLKSAKLIEKNIFEAKNLKTPFVLGLIRPKIYLPMGITVEERGYILQHEQTHIHRKDHVIKVLAFLTLSVHWFNPLVWTAFILMSIDMELSCDERVLKEMNEDIKKPYANSLLSLATRRHILNGSPLAFGEGNVKGRIKNVLNYRKHRFWVIVYSIVLVTAVGVGLMANPKAATGGKSIINNTNDVLKITVKTQPGNASSLKTTEDRHQIIEVINYINCLDLKKTTKDVGQEDGMSYIIRIYYSNDTSREYVHFGKYFFIESGNGWYEMPYKQAEKFEAIYNRLSVNVKESEQNKNVNNDDQITSSAREFINKDIVYAISEKWAEALKTREGITRYELMAPESKTDYYNSLVDINGEEYPWVIGVSSPYVVSYGIKASSTGSVITYITETSESEEYIYQEQLFFNNQGGKTFVSKYGVTVSYLRKDLYEQAIEIQKTVNEGRQTWRLDPESVVLEFVRRDLGVKGGEITFLANNDAIFKKDDGVEIKIKLYKPINNNNDGFLAIYEYSIGTNHYIVDNDYLAPRTLGD